MNSFLPYLIDNHQQHTKSIQTLLDKKMDRRDFLIYLGTLFFLVTGVTGIMKALHESISPHKGSTQVAQFGYGPYGGHSREAS